MKIIHIIYDSIGNPWLGGGGGFRTQELYSKLRYRHNINIFTGNFLGAPKNINGVNYTRIGFGSNYLISRLSFLFFVYFYVIFSSADIYIEDLGMPFPLGLPLFKKNVLASVQLVPDRQLAKKRKLIGLIMLFCYNLTFRFYNNFISVSDFVSNFIRQKKNNAKIFLIRNGVNLPQHTEKNNKEKYILYLGRIDIVGKGLDTLIKSVSYLKYELKTDVFIKIVGSGEEGEISNLKELIQKHNVKDNFRLEGFKKDKEKENLIINSRFFVLPSINEAAPITALEAFSYGKPMIGTNVGGLKEILTMSSSAFVFEPGDYLELANLMKKLWLDDKLIEELSKKAKLFVMQYDWNHITSQYEKILTSLVGL
jgi:glycogen synthase